MASDFVLALDEFLRENTESLHHLLVQAGGLIEFPAALVERRRRSGRPVLTVM